MTEWVAEMRAERAFRRTLGKWIYHRVSPLKENAVILPTSHLEWYKSQLHECAAHFIHKGLKPDDVSYSAEYLLFEQVMLTAHVRTWK